MKRPAFQFYPADWRGNAKLRRCSESARGAWIDILCVLHDGDEYGICRWPLSDLARAAGVSLRSIKELVRNDVLKGADRGVMPYVYVPRHAGKDGEPATLVETNDGPTWYSSRLVRDEYIRKRRGSATQFSADNPSPKWIPKSTPKGAPKPPIGVDFGDGPSSSSSASKEQELPTTSERDALVDDPVKSMIDSAVKYMGGCGVGEKQARSVIGMTRRDVGDSSAAELFSSMRQQRIASPVAWLRKAADSRNRSKASGLSSKQNNLLAYAQQMEECHEAE